MRGSGNVIFQRLTLEIVLYQCCFCLQICLFSSLIPIRRIFFLFAVLVQEYKTMRGSNTSTTPPAAIHGHASQSVESLVLQQQQRSLSSLFMGSYTIVCLPLLLFLLYLLHTSITRIAVLLSARTHHTQSEAIGIKASLIKSLRHATIFHHT